jgi:excisionase family DNA binding protein
MPRRKTQRPPAAQPVGELEPLLMVKDVQQILHLSKPAIYQLINERGLPSVKLNGARRFERSQLQAWIAQQRHAS